MPCCGGKGEGGEEMEGVLEALGTVTVILLLAIGLLSGWIASRIAGRRRGLYMVLGVAGALAMPVLLAVLGLGVLAAYGAAAILVASLLGAVIVLVVARALFD